MGDTNMCTDNDVLLQNTLNSPTIICVQKKAEKKLVTESDIIEANKIGFTDSIGKITNYITSMIERQAGFEKGSPEYETLSYRIKCGQLEQQNAIDSIKGIIAKPMPEYWYNQHKCKPCDGDSDDEIKTKEYNARIVAAHKPYFMVYVYPALRTQYNTYVSNNNKGAVRRFQKYGISGMDSLEQFNEKTQQMEDYIRYYYKNMPVGNNPCVVNRICWRTEQEFNTFKNQRAARDEFDYTILKSNVGYTKRAYDAVNEIYQQYIARVNAFQKRARTEKLDEDFMAVKRRMFVETFKADCERACSNEDELCDIVLDLCYTRESTKQFAWDVCGDTILRNLANLNGGWIQYPKEVHEGGEFEFCGRQFILCERQFEEDEEIINDSIE